MVNNLRIQSTTCSIPQRHFGRCPASTRLICQRATLKTVRGGHKFCCVCRLFVLFQAINEIEESEKARTYQRNIHEGADHVFSLYHFKSNSFCLPRSHAEKIKVAPEDGIGDNDNVLLIFANALKGIE